MVVQFGTKIVIADEPLTTDQLKIRNKLFALLSEFTGTPTSKLQFQTRLTADLDMRHRDVVRFKQQLAKAFKFEDPEPYRNYEATVQDLFVFVLAHLT